MIDSKKSSCSCLRGFTLIELLVVISIIALLLSILLPALRSVKEQAKLVVCASNMHQILGGLHVYAAGNEGKLPPHISMNDNGSAVWWDFPNYMACHAPNPVGGSLGWQFADILPSVDIWFCPLSPMSPDTELEGDDDGVLRSYQEIYANPDPVNHTWVWMTMMPLWRYGGFADKALTNNEIPFKGPGLKPASNLTADGRESDLAIMDFIAYNVHSDHWFSAHPFKTSHRGTLFHEGPTGAGGIDILEEVGSIRYNSGYIDGHVERFNTSDTDPDSQYMGRGLNFSLPKNW